MTEARVMLQCAQQSTIHIIQAILFHDRTEYETEPHFQPKFRKV